MDYIKPNGELGTVPAPFGAYEQLRGVFGDPATNPGSFTDEWIVGSSHTIYTQGLPEVINVQCNRIMVPLLHLVWFDMTVSGALKHVKTYDGCCVIRPVRGSTSESLHAWGLAIDLNAAENELGTAGNMDAGIIAAFKAHGFFWGGDFQHRKDPMHFEYTTGVI